MLVEIDGKLQDIRVIWYSDGIVHMLDQRKIPERVEIFMARDYRDIAFAIKEMVVRGAPAIGVTAAYGMAQAKLQGKELNEVFNALKNTRPTAYDLFYALSFMKEKIENGEDPLKSSEEYADMIAEKARKIGEFGNTLIENNFKILTHCNAGALAVLDWGTALAPMRFAKRYGKKIFVWVDETRPRLQGARLTSWELKQEGIDHKIIADNAAGFLMKRGEVDMVIVGADRIALNGDFANKIGTYEKAVVARENRIPFYVAAPISTIDKSIKSGNEIPIEERSENEVLYAGSCRIAPEGVNAYNPAFDVTPNSYVTGFITEYGIIKPEKVKEIVNKDKRW